MRNLCLALLALGLVLAPSASAFVPLRTKGGKDYAWNLDSSLPNVVNGKVTYYLGAVTNDATASDPRGAARAGILAWEQVADTRIAFLEDPSRPASRHRSGDKVNVVMWVSDDLDPFTLATTFPTRRKGRMTDADLLINDDFVWSDATPPISGIADIQSVVAHEWGHAIGLDHVTTARATMFYSFPLGAIYFRTLHPDDEAAVASIYPAGSFDSSRATIRGTVDVLGRSNDRGVAVFAVDARTGEIAVSALSEKDGTYAVRGLLPGTYRIVAGRFIPLSPLNAYWKSSATDFLAAPLTDTGVSPGPTTLITVTGGDDESGHDLSVAARSS
ncbi:MAG: matrixin family metalloprotease, partial [Planctomycetota bacterium]